VDLRDIRFRFLHFTRKKYGIIITIAVAIFILSMPQPQPFEFAGKTIVLSLAGKKMLALLASLVVIFITEALPIGTTVGIVYAWIVFFGILPGGSKTKYISLGIITFCALSAAFIAGHTIAALMLPVGLALIRINGGFKSAPNLSKLFLFSIAYGCSIGGLGTPSGGGRNVLMIGFLEEFYDVRIGYGSWMIMALPIVIILIPCLWLLLLKTFKPEVSDLHETSEKIRKEVKMLPIGTKEWMVIIIFLSILFLWFTKSNLGIGMIALFGATLFIVFGLINWKDYQEINWGIALLYFGAIGLGTSLQMTGAATWLAAKSLSLVEHIIPLNGKMTVTAIGVVMTSGMTQIMSDGPCVAIIGPILLESARLSGIDPVFFGIAVAISSAFAFMLTIGTPANAIVYSSGYLRPKDFFKAGFFIYIIAVIVLLIVAYFWWGILGVGIDGFH